MARTKRRPRKATKQQRRAAILLEIETLRDKTVKAVGRKRVKIDDPTWTAAVNRCIELRKELAKI